MMKLVVSGPSPFARKVQVTVIELGLQDEVEEIRVSARPDAVVPELNAVNPLGRIPALQTEDGTCLFDSRVITRYLDARAGGGLYPEGDWGVPVLEALADGMLDSALSMVYEKRFRETGRVSHDWINWQWTKISRALDAVETGWLPALEGPLTAGQIALGCAVGYIDFRHGDRPWRQDRPGLAAWAETFRARPSMVACDPNG